MARLTKRQMKEDKFVTGLLKSQEYFNRYRTQILLGVAGFFVVAIVAVLFITNARSAEQAAEDQYGMASMSVREFFNTFEADRNQDGIPDGNLDSSLTILTTAKAEFQNIIDQHGGSDMAKFATFYLASISFKLGNYAEAESYYQKFLDKYYINKGFIAAAKLGLAGCKESLRDFEGAGMLYLEIAQKYPDFPQQTEALRKAAINLARGGLNDQAKLAFELLEKSDAPRSTVNDAREFLYEQNILNPYTYNLD
jgi:tetratricopeptide (TPR) repeat protein